MIALQAPTTRNRKEVTILSPLRYPGAKRRLSRFIQDTIQLNQLTPQLFIEPFAGGASVSLQLLADGTVQSIGLIERDPLVASFWQVVFGRSSKDFDWLIDQLNTIEVTLDHWNQFRQTKPTGRRDQALACLFLNRTSFSGILAKSAGPIGGQAQQSKYKIDCRFPRETLEKRLHQARALKDRVAFVYRTDWQRGIERIRDNQAQGQLPADIFYYFDPPFFKKADRLYNFYFSQRQHKALHSHLMAMPEKWLLSYDLCEEAKKLYTPDISTEIEFIYSTAQTAGQKKARELIVTNLPQLPGQTRIWHTTNEWNSGQFQAELQSNLNQPIKTGV